MLLLINMDIVVMILDLMHVHSFHYQTIVGVKMSLVFGADNSSSVHVDNKKKDILLVGEGLTQGLDDTIITTHAINLPESGKPVKSALKWKQ